MRQGRWCFVRGLLMALCVLFGTAMQSRTVHAEGENEDLVSEYGFIFMDPNGNEVTELQLHAGETVKLRMYKEDEFGDYSYSFLVQSPDTELSVQYESDCVEFWAEDLSEPEWVTVRGLKETSSSQRYYLAGYTFAGTDPSPGRAIARLPISILPAEEGVTYPAPDGGEARIYDSLEEVNLAAAEAFREHEQKMYTFVLKYDASSEMDAWTYGQQCLEDAFGWDSIFSFYSDQLEYPADLGDYAKFSRGSGVMTLGSDSVCYKGREYVIFELDLEHSSLKNTREQEDWVDSEIASMFSRGGALEWLKGVSDYEKIRGCMDYIHENVSYIGTRDGYYHTVYSALHDHMATCEGYSLLLYRMLRELGIANRILVSADSEAHGYNLVLLDGKYYYCDPTAYIILKGEDNFDRAQLQKDYLKPEFQSAIMSRVSREDYSADNGSSGSDSQAGLNGLKESADGRWYYYLNGRVVSDYTGLVYDETVGWWYVENGTINFDYNGLVPYNDAWWCVAGGAVIFDYTGLWCDPAVGWWYVENGTINFGYNGLIPYGDAWWCVAGGAVIFDYTGLWCDPVVGWWYVENGTINFGYNGLIPCGDAWWCVAGGAVIFDYTGLWCDPAAGWWYVENGTINFGYNGLIPYGDAWWCVAGGAVAFDHTGLWYDPTVGWWYVENGVISFGYSGTVTFDGEIYDVTNGQVVF